MLKKKTDEKQILSNKEKKALINNLIDQIEFLKNELRSKGNIITKSVKHQKQVLVKGFSGAKIVDMKHYKKPTREKSPAEIKIYVGTNDLSGDKSFTPT